MPINPNLPLANPVDISGPEGQGPVGLIANFYSMGFLLAGFLAFIMIVYGGVRYTFSGGSHSIKEDAKDAIQQAFYGLGLLLVAYLILQTINPDLTTLRLPTLPPYTAPPLPVRFPNRTGFGCQVSGFNHCSAKNDCSDLTTDSGKPLCPPEKCVQQAFCDQAGLNLQCAGDGCVPIVGHVIKDGGLADPRMVQVLTCMLAKNGGKQYRVTEAMPPVVPHSSSCHNNGCCVDMTLASQAPNDCAAVNEMMKFARECGAKGVLNEYFPPDSKCGGRNTEHATGVHIHVIGC